MTTTTQPQTTRVLTPEEAERFERLAETIEAEKPDIIRRAKLSLTAGDEPGFNGDVRRAIHSGGVTLEKIAAAANIEVFALCDFLEGTVELTSNQIAAIVQLLGLQLVRPIVAPAKSLPTPRQKS